MLGRLLRLAAWTERRRTAGKSEQIYAGIDRDRRSKLRSMFGKLTDETEDLRREFNIGYSELEEFVKLDRDEIEELREINAKYKQDVEWLELEIMAEYDLESDEFYDHGITCPSCQEDTDSECDCENENDRRMRDHAMRLKTINDRYTMEVGWYGDVIKEIWMRCCMVE